MKVYDIWHTGQLNNAVAYSTELNRQHLGLIEALMFVLCGMGGTPCCLDKYRNHYTKYFSGSPQHRSRFVSAFCHFTFFTLKLSKEIKGKKLKCFKFFTFD